MTALALAQGRGVRAPVMHRFWRMVQLDPVAEAALGQALQRGRSIKRGREVLRESTPIAGAMLVATGWAARVRTLKDGQRQFLSLIVPGDVIGLSRHAGPLATATIIALTDLEICLAPPLGLSAALDEAYAIGQAQDEAYLLANITRLGRLTAEERLGDLMLELLERADAGGLAFDGGFDLPMTQEMLADVTGLTPVHVNRMLQQMRRRGDISWQRGWLTLNDPAGLANRLDRAPTRVSAEA